MSSEATTLRQRRAPSNQDEKTEEPTTVTTVQSSSQNERSKRLRKYGFSVAAIGGAVLTARQAKLLDILTSVELYRGLAFQLGILATVVVIAIYVELRWIQPWRLGTGRPGNFAGWQQRYPKAIPAATLASCIASLAWTIAFWPFWGIWTIPCLFMLTLGFINAVDLIIL
jgi:hypothetical protein